MQKISIQGWRAQLNVNAYPCDTSSNYIDTKIKKADRYKNWINRIAYSIISPVEKDRIY